MSWKLLVSAGLLCIVASPLMAAPSLSVTNTGGLDANGNWVWTATVTPDGTLYTNSGASGNPANTVGGSVATELGFAATSANLVSVAKNAANFPNDNPGTPIGAGFPTNTNVSPNYGVQILGNNAAINEGSTFFPVVGLQTAAQPAQNLATITTLGPSTGNNIANAATRTTTLTWSGAYTGKGRIAQGNTNNDTFSGNATRVVIAGDANLNGAVDLADFNAVVNNFGSVGFWNKGNFNNPNGGAAGTNTTVGLEDFNLVVNRFGATTGAGAGALSGGAVPEPASIVLAGLAAIAGLGLVRRKK